MFRSIQKQSNLLQQMERSLFFPHFSVSFGFSFPAACMWVPSFEFRLHHVGCFELSATGEPQQGREKKIHRLSALCVRNIHISTHYNCDVTRDSTECFAIFVPPNKFYCFNVDCVIKSAQRERRKKKPEPTQTKAIHFGE